MTDKTAAPLDKHFLALDKQIAMKYVTYLVEKRIADLPETRRDFCEAAGCHPKLLNGNPHIGAIAKLFQDQSNIERLGELTLREFLVYHHHYLRHGHRYGAPELQQRWLGRDVARSPMDCWVYQELIWETRPDFVVELGVAYGGATHFCASILDLVGHGEVIGIDESLPGATRAQNRRITYVEGGSTAEETLAKVRAMVGGKRVLVIAGPGRDAGVLLAQIRCYAPLVHVGGYVVVEDSLDGFMNDPAFPGEGAMAAARAYVAENDDFTFDRRWGERYVLSLNPNGYLLRIK